MTHGELFAGISGFGLGFEANGIETLWAVDIDKNCKRVQKHHYLDRLWFDDVCTVDKHNLPYVDIISFGSPCQDLSIAGKRGGLKGERSGLFFEAIRIVRELKPAIAIWENVPGAFSSNSGRDFLAVITAFRECGARQFGWRTIDAQYCGVPQRRRRIILIADFRGERVGRILFKPESMCRDFTESKKAGKDVAFTLNTHTGSSSCKGEGGINTTLIAGTLNSGAHPGGFNGQDVGNLVVPPLTCDPYGDKISGVRRLTPVECERLQGFPRDWTLADGIPDSARYRMLGNAVNVAVTKRLGKNIVEANR